MGEASIQYSVDQRIATILLNRPEKRNAFHPDMIRELTGILEQASHAADVKIILLKARGPAFSAGADLEYLRQMRTDTFQANLEDSWRLAQLFEVMYTCGKLLIAQVEGPAIAGGCGLAMLADLTYATPEAVFGYSELSIGFVPAIVSPFLVRKIGAGRARELLLTARRISASKALEWGMIHGIFEPQTIEKEVSDLALQLSESVSAESVRWTKKLLADLWSLSLEDSLKLASEVNARVRESDDCKRGVDAFLSGTPLKW